MIEGRACRRFVRRQTGVSSKSICSERHFGSIARSFGLAREIDDSEARARYNDGVLELTLPKNGGGSARSIGIS